ncbi:hypothetical protein DPMN_194780 [Dreissena polymorpha]|uniref:Uncharacterized protein n=1 Tax=Dreissena polymorpha TaxID=45954 RepID=A0A9D3Y4V7_DREPO|nr:hypothetical protein DPMN_194780 [Dreissena polymorpha]
MWTNGRRTKTNSKTSPEQSTIFLLVRKINKTNENCPPPWWPCFFTDRDGTICELIIYKTNHFTKFHDDWAKNVTSRKNAPPIGGHVFHRSGPFTNSSEIINKTNVLSNLHDEWAKIVTSSVLTRKTAMTNAPPTGGHVFQRTGTTFELNQHIIKANILTKFELNRDIIGTFLLTMFHKDRTINVASRVFTNKCGWTDNGRTTDKDRSQKLT